MKTNWFYWLSAWLLCVSFVPLSAVNTFASRFESYNRDTDFSNNFFYKTSPLANWSFEHAIEVEVNRTGDNERENRTGNFTWKAINHHGWYNLTYLARYNYLYDRATPSGISYHTRQHNRAGGLGLSLKPLYNLTLNGNVEYAYNRQTDSQTRTTAYLNRGVKGGFDLNWNLKHDDWQLELTPAFSSTNLEFNKRSLWGGAFVAAYQGKQFNTGLNADWRELEEDIFTYRSWDDHQTKNNLGTTVYWQNNLYNWGWLRLADNFTYERNEFTCRNEKDYKDNEHNLSLITGGRWGAYSIELTGKRRLGDRQYKLEANSRKIDERVFDARFAYHFVKTDSLVFTRQLRLTRTDYPAVTNVLDNDQYTEVYQLSSYNWWRRNLFIVNHLSYTVQHEVYLTSQMSANNMQKQSYNYKPAIYWLSQAGRMAISQVYHLRADYDTWDFEEINGQIRNDNIYRRFLATYRWYFLGREFNQPLTDTALARDNLLPQPWFVTLEYGFDSNDFGQRVDGVYQKNTVNRYHTVVVDAHARLGRLVLRLRPKISWTSRREYNHLFSASWELKPDSRVVGSFNPVGSSWHDVIWKSTLELEIRF